MRKKLRYTLRRVSAYDAAMAASEAAALGGDGEGGIFLRNACLLARALYRNGKRRFASGEEAAKALPPETLACWMRAYGLLCRSQRQDPQLRDAEKDRLAADEEARLRWKVLRRFGVLPWEARAKAMGREDLLYCVLMLTLDEEEKLARLCPSCRRSLTEGGCPACGTVEFEQNPNFDPSRFEELKHHGLSETAAP